MGLWRKESKSEKKEEHNQHIKKEGDKWVVLNKSGEVISHHDSKENAEESFRAMEMNKHDG
jgi:hypothetical protein